MPRLLLLLFLAACGDSEATIDGFDTSCATADDCVAVLVGDVCGCGCTYGAINVAEALSWAEYDADLRDSCANPLDCSVCQDAAVSCDGGVCAAWGVEE